MNRIERSIIDMHVCLVHFLSLIFIVIIIVVSIVLISLFCCIKFVSCSPIWINLRILPHRWEHLLLHLTQLEIIKIVFQCHICYRHALRNPISLENWRHCIYRNNWKYYLSITFLTIGIETVTLSEQHWQLISWFIITERL